MKDELTAKAHALEWLEAECFDLRCETVQFYDDADIIWHVYSHHMAEPKLRIEGTGDTAISAINDAMLPKDDPRRRDYVPEYNELQTQEARGVNYSDIIKEDFFKLWSDKWQGTTQQIELPMMCVNSTGVSIFVSKLEDERFIISDGGLLSDESVYENEELGVSHYTELIEQFRVKFTENEKTGVKLTYLETDKVELLSARAFDLAHYIQATILFRFVQQCPTDSQAQ